MHDKNQKETALNNYNEIAPISGMHNGEREFGEFSTHERYGM